MDATSENRQIVVIKPVSSQTGLLVLAIVISTFVAACGGGGGGSSQTSSPSLWVANRASSTVASFSAAARKHSGTPSATRTNLSQSLFEPEGVVFDKQNNMWISNCSGSDDQQGSVAKFSAGQVAKLERHPLPEPAVELLDDGNSDVFSCPYGLQFDHAGNLWVTNRFALDLVAFDPTQLKQTGAHLPRTQISSGVFGDPVDILFDKSGSLWIADTSSSIVYAYKKQSLDAALGFTNIIDPDIVIGPNGMNGSDAIAFDRDGNLWVANCSLNNLVKFNAADLAASGSPTPAVTISATVVETATGSTLSLDCPEGLSFDAQGSLWASNAISDNFGSLAKFTSSQLAADGMPAPAVFLDSDSTGANLRQPVLITFNP